MSSASVSILAAETPIKPNEPTTSISGSNVLISWDWPNNRGSPITSYTITIRHSDSLTFTASAECDGTQNSVVLNRECQVAIATLRTAPYNLPWGSSVFVKLSATNLYGASEESNAGNGAVILTNPDAPINV